MMITVTVNGSTKRIARGTTVSELIDGLGLQSDGVAVAVNRRVIPRSEHAAQKVPEGAEVEVIRAVGGG